MQSNALRIQEYEGAKLLRRIILGFLTLIVVLVSVGPALIGSVTEPQIANRLELYQTDLLLQASELEPPEGFDVEDLSGILGGAASLEQVTEQYAKTRASVQDNLAELADQVRDRRLGASSSEPTDILPPTPLTTPTANLSSEGQAPQPPLPDPQRLLPPLQKNIQQQQVLSYDLGLRLGILYAVQEQDTEAIATWTPIAEGDLAVPSASFLASSPEILNQGATAQILIGLWDEPSQILPDAEPQLRETLTGWFRTRSLEQLYELQHRPDALEQLYAQ
jgi:hypothetical protein